MIVTPPQPSFTDFDAENRYYEAENEAIRAACRELENENGDLIADLDEEGIAALADNAWIHEQFNLGLMKPYYGEYVAVVNKVLLGHDKSLKALRERVVRETGYSVERIVTSHVDRFDR